MSEMAASLFLAEVSLNEKPMSKIKILHVDDDPCILEVSKQILEVENNFEVDTALSVEEAFKRMEKQSFDVVVSDYVMPQKNGLQFLQELREKRNRIPFIMFTGKSREEVAVEALNLGADRYINKNGSPETVYCELADAINKTVERKKSRQQLAASESKYRMLVEKSLQGILVTKVAPLRLIFANDAMGKILGYSLQELLSLSPEGIMSLVHHQDRAVFFKRMENRFRGEPAESCFEFRAVRKDGSLIWLSALSNRVEYDGQPAVLGMFLDVNERKKAEEVLRRSEEKYRELANCLPEIVFETDMNGQLVFANERAAEISGYSLSEIEKGLNLLQFIAPEDRERGTKIIQRLLAGGGCVPAEYTFVRKDGTTFPALITATPRISENAVTGLRGLVIDITERKKVMNALRESEEKYRRQFEEALDAIFVADAETGILVDCNPAACELVGRAKSEIVGMHQRILHPPEKNEGEFNRTFKEHLGKKKGHVLETQVITKSGEIKDVAIKANIFTLGNKTLMQGSFRDVTERKKAEELLKDSVAKYRDFAESLPEIVFEVDAKGNLVFVNQKAPQITGYSQDEFGNNFNFIRLVVPDEREKAIANIKRLLSGENVGSTEYNLVKKDGAVFPVMIWATPRIVQNKVAGLRGIVVDISEYKKAEESLRETKEYFDNLLNYANAPIIVWDNKKKITLFNNAFEAFTGYSKESMLRENIEVLFPASHKTRILETIGKATRGEKWQSVEVPILCKDGQTRIALWNSANVTDKDGNIVATIAQGQDITERKKAEQALKESEEKYRKLFEASMDAIFVADIETGIIVDCNSAASTLVGRQKSELVGQHQSIITPQEQMEAGFARVFKQHLKDQTKTLETQIIMKTGEIRDVAVRDTIIELEGKKLMQGTLSDITQRKKTEEALLASEEKYRSTFESTGTAAAIIEEDTTFSLVNTECEKLSGYSKEELEGKKSWTEFVVKEDLDRMKEKHRLRRIDEKAAPMQYEFRFIDRYGETKNILLTIAMIPGTKKSVASLLDITERKKAEGGLRKSEEKYRTLVEQSTQGIVIVKGPIPHIVFANSVISKILGYSVQELTSLSPQQVIGLVHPDDRDLFFGRFKERLEGKPTPTQYGVRGIRKDGTIVWLELSSALIEYDGQPAVQAMFADITERKKMEDALRQDQDMLEAITENLGAGFVTISKDYLVLYANRFIKNNVGDVEGKQCYATLNTLDHICPDCGVKKVFEDGVAKDSHEYSQMGINGKPYYVELIATPLKDKDGNVTAALEFVVDIAEKKRIQQKLQANEAKFRAISDSAIDAIFMFDEEDRITYWNPAAERIFGYTEKEIVGEKVGATIVPPRFHKDHLKLTSDLGKVENMKKNAGEILEFPAFRKDGTEFSMELSMAPLQLEGEQYFVAIARDVTDRKKAEELLNQTMDQLVLVNEKVEVVGSLTRHDVRNKLSALTGYAYLLKKKHADQADILDGVSKMEQAVKDIVAIFDFAKMYEQLGVEELTYINAEKALNEAIALFSGLSSLEFINDCHGLSLMADSLLTQLFYNLIDNSLKHGKKVTKIRVHYEKADQDKLIVVYEDDGVGISAENKSKLFKEGFSTSGTSGHGLFLLRKMMGVYGWSIQENGEPGKGAKFTMTIPRINQNGKENFQIA